MPLQYNFSHVGLLHLDASGIWERTGNSVSIAYSDGSQLDFSAGTSGGGIALAWFNKPNSSRNNHYVEVTGGSGATRANSQPAINALDDNDQIWGGYQTFTSPEWRVFSVIAGSQTTLAAVTATAIAENVTVKLERVSSSTIRLSRAGTALTSIASTLYNTIPYRGIRYTNIQYDNLYKLFETDTDTLNLAFTTGRVNVRGNQSTPAPTINETGVTGKVNVRGHAQTLGGQIIETVYGVDGGKVNVRGHQQAISHSGTEESIGNVGRVQVRGAQQTIGWEMELFPRVGRVLVNGFSVEISGALFIDHKTGLVTVRGHQSEPLDTADVVHNIGVVRVAGNNHSSARLWVPDTTASQTWSKP